MSTLFAVDPGLREAGCAVFRGGQLASARAVYADAGEDVEQWRAMGRALADAAPEDVERIAVEEMRPRRNMAEAVPRIMQLVGVTGAFVGAFSEAVPAELVDPHVWTAGLAKTANHARIRSRLTAAELAVLDEALGRTRKDNRKEVYDAVGIGLFVLRRL